MIFLCTKIYDFFVQIIDKSIFKWYNDSMKVYEIFLYNEMKGLFNYEEAYFNITYGNILNAVSLVNYCFC